MRSSWIATTSLTTATASKKSKGVDCTTYSEVCRFHGARNAGSLCESLSVMDACLNPSDQPKITRTVSIKTVKRNASRLRSSQRVCGIKLQSSSSGSLIFGSGDPHHGQKPISMKDEPPSWIRRPYPPRTTVSKASGQAVRLSCTSHSWFRSSSIRSQQCTLTIFACLWGLPETSGWSL